MKKNLFRIALATLMGMIAAPAFLSAQQEDGIVIINQDGEEIKGKVVLGNQQDDVEVEAGVSAKIVGDKIIIIDANGEKKEIDISGARSVSVQQSVKSVDQDGEQQTVRTGKAIIIGPDGEKKVIELEGPIQMGEGEGANMFMFKNGNFGKLNLDMIEELPMLKFRQGLPGQFQATGKLGKYMIGVVCKPVPDELRAHLDLEQGVGLLVESVTEDGPAAEAGIQKHDILMYAQDEQLATNDDLVDVIQTVGKEDGSVSIGAVRSGKEVSFKVKPMERPADQLLRGPANFKFQQFGPGVILGDGELELPNIEAIPAVPDMKALQEQMKQQMEEMQKQMQEMQEQMKKMRDRDNG